MVKKRRIKRIMFHPIASYLLLTFFVIVLSGVLSLFNFGTTYNIVNQTTLNIEQQSVEVFNLLNFDGMKYIISMATKNLISFAPLSMFLIASLGICVAESSGFFDSLFKKAFAKLNNNAMTFIIIFLGTISTLINEIGYVLLIPIAAIMYKSKGRNPLVGIIAAFASIAFATGTTIFVGSTEVNLIPYTTAAARLIDSVYHVSLLSNIFIMIISSIIVSIVGTVIIEKIVSPRFGKYKEKKDLSETANYDVIDIDELEQEKLKNEYNEKRGYKWALITSIIVLVFFIYSLIPSLPFSGLLLDMEENTYLKQLFGDNSYFQDGFAYMVTILFLIAGLSYGIGSRKFKNDRDVYNKSEEYLKNIGGVVFLIFFASQLISIFKKTNIGTIITGIFANVLNGLNFGGIPYLIIAIMLIAIANLFLTTTQSKWIILSPVIVPALMQSNISPQFMQFVMRASDSMTNGITPLYAYFVIFIAYMNMYNKDKENPITIFGAIKLLIPYFIIISITWLLLLIGWYIIGLPIGPGVFPVL